MSILSMGNKRSFLSCISLTLLLIAIASVSLPAALGVDLATTIADTPDPVIEGGALNYEVRWENLGTTTATSATGQVAFDANFQFLGLSLSGNTGGGSCNATGNSIFCALPEIAQNQTVLLNIDGLAPTNGVTNLTIVALIDVQQDTNEQNNLAMESTQVISVPEPSVLWLLGPTLILVVVRRRKCASPA